MDKNEIINYLKDNKLKGVAFAFMPNCVKDWCRNKYDRSIFMECLSSHNGPAEEQDIKWFNCRTNHVFDMTSVISLIESYDGIDTEEEIERRERDAQGIKDLIDACVKEN